jgi:hypothetical protein
MRNFTLPRGPCNFLNLRISHWEVLFLLLLCFSSLSVPLLSGAFFSPPEGASIWRSFPLPPSLGALLAGAGARAALGERSADGAARLQAALGWSRRGSRRVCRRGHARLGQCRAGASGWWPGARADAREAWSRRASGSARRGRGSLRMHGHGAARRARLQRAGA